MNPNILGSAATMAALAGIASNDRRYGVAKAVIPEQTDEQAAASLRAAHDLQTKRDAKRARQAARQAKGMA